MDRWRIPTVPTNAYINTYEWLAIGSK